MFGLTFAQIQMSAITGRFQPALQVGHDLFRTERFQRNLVKPLIARDIAACHGSIEQLLGTGQQQNRAGFGRQIAEHSDIKSQLFFRQQIGIVNHQQGAMTAGQMHLVKLLHQPLQGLPCRFALDLRHIAQQRKTVNRRFAALPGTGRQRHDIDFFDMTTDKFADDLGLARALAASQEQHLIAKDRQMPQRFQHMLALTPAKEKAARRRKRLMREIKMRTQLFQQGAGWIDFFHVFYVTGCV